MSKTPEISITFLDLQCVYCASRPHRVALGILENTLAFEEERRLKKQCQSLLTVARNLFTHLGRWALYPHAGISSARRSTVLTACVNFLLSLDDVTVLLSQIMSEARQLTEAERCSLFLLDQNELVAKVFDGDVPEKASTVEVRNAVSSASQFLYCTFAKSLYCTALPLRVRLCTLG